MKKLLNLAMILMIAIFTLSCSNTETPDAVKNEVNSNSIQNLQAKSSGEEIKDPSTLTPEEQQEMINEGIQAIEFFVKSPQETEFIATSGRKAVTLCHDNYNSLHGNACVYNSSGYLVNVSWGPKLVSHDGGDTAFEDINVRVYTGNIVSQCNC